jgi:hypothetical protein
LPANGDFEDEDDDEHEYDLLSGERRTVNGER